MGLIDTSISWNDIWFMLQGAGLTLLVTFWAMLGGTVLGIVFGVFRASAPWWAHLGTSRTGARRRIPLHASFLMRV